MIYCVALIDQRDFFRAVITPFELRLSLNPRYAYVSLRTPHMYIVLENLSSPYHRHRVLILLSSLQWTGDYETDFSRVLPGLRDDISMVSLTALASLDIICIYCHKLCSIYADAITPGTGGR